MHVVATAGHVDHGKSTLVRALTGMEPDRWAEEKRRGMTLDLGFAWTRLPVGAVAFVDVPGHERFVPTMLAGVSRLVSLRWMSVIDRPVAGISTSPGVKVALIAMVSSLPLTMSNSPARVTKPAKRVAS